jgi:hypothetical protein
LDGEAVIGVVDTLMSGVGAGAAGGAPTVSANGSLALSGFAGGCIGGAGGLSPQALGPAVWGAAGANASFGAVGFV